MQFGCFLRVGEWSCRNVHFDVKMHIFVENQGFRVSGVDFTPLPGLGRRNKARKWNQRAKTHLLVQFERHLRVGGRFLVRVECVEQMYPSAFTPIRVVFAGGGAKCGYCGRKERSGWDGGGGEV